MVYTGTGLTTQTVSYTYDALGRQQTVVDASGTTTYTYDNSGNLITSATPEGTLHYVYNSLNQHIETYTTTTATSTTKITDITYAYDVLGRLTSMSVNNLNGDFIGHASRHPVLLRRRGTSPTSSRSTTESASSTPTPPSIRSRRSPTRPEPTQTASFAYTYDGDGHETQEVEKLGASSTPPTETINYTYNADGWLYSEVATPSGAWSSTIGAQWGVFYGYDADGNRLETDGGDFMSTNPTLKNGADEEQANWWEYNANGEMTYNNTYNPDQDNPSNTYTTYTYDNNGNQIGAVSYTEHQQGEDGDDNDSDQTWTYDVRGEMVKYVDGNNTTTTYTYDDAGDRVKEVRGSTTTTYLIDSNNPTGEAQPIEEHTNGATNPSVTYFVGLNGAQGQANGSTVIYMLRDNRGYARVFLNSSGTATQYDQFDAFGNQMTGNNLPSTHYFPDGVFDAPSGLTFHFGGRQSSSSMGTLLRWTHKDTATIKPQFR